MENIITFEKALDITSSKHKSILLGNGFSIAQGGGRYSYSTLRENAPLEPDDPIQRVFEVLDTDDFERVMWALEHAGIIEDAYGRHQESKHFVREARRLRDALIGAVRKVHPSVRHEISDEQCSACRKFLENFQKVFTLNYDLLLYWVILHKNDRKFTDGFGLGEERNGLRKYSADAHCNVHYVHGALHLFLDSQRETCKVVAHSSIVEDIENRINSSNRLPLFVAEGTSEQKMGRINGVPYLRQCLEKLSVLSGALFVFGHSVGKSDYHIYEAISKSKIDTAVFCVHDIENNVDSYAASVRLCPGVRSWLRKIDNILYFVDASSVKVWGTSR